jgi:hypothetical protein
MVLKYLVPFLAISSVYCHRLGSDPKTWSPSVTCEQCMSIVNRTETTLSLHACGVTVGDERIVCRNVVDLALEMFPPEVVCQKLGHCPKKVWLLF